MLDAAERAIRRSGSSTSLGEVATEAGYARSAVYAAFPDKAALLRALSERHAGRMLASLAPQLAEADEPVERLRFVVNAITRWVETQPGLFQALDRDLAGPNRLAQGVFEVLAAAEEHELLANDPSEVMARRAGPWARAMIGAVTAAAAWWVEQPRAARIPRSELVDHLTTLFWEGGIVVPSLNKRTR